MTQQEDCVREAAKQIIDLTKHLAARRNEIARNTSLSATGKRDALLKERETFRIETAKIRREIGSTLATWEQEKEGRKEARRAADSRKIGKHLETIKANLEAEDPLDVALRVVATGEPEEVRALVSQDGMAELERRFKKSGTTGTDLSKFLGLVRNGADKRLGRGVEPEDTDQERAFYAATLPNLITEVQEIAKQETDRVLVVPHPDGTMETIDFTTLEPVQDRSQS